MILANMTPSRLAGLLPAFFRLLFRPISRGPGSKGRSSYSRRSCSHACSRKDAADRASSCPTSRLGPVLIRALALHTNLLRKGGLSAVAPARRRETLRRSLDLGGHHSWRLPSKDEIPRFSKLTGLEDLAGYHWSRSPYAEDHKQAWIVDPAGSPPTTIPRDRKPMRTRCVMTP